MSDKLRFDVVAKGPTVLSSHAEPKEAAEAAKKAAPADGAIVEVHDKELKRAIFRARGGESRWITR